MDDYKKGGDTVSVNGLPDPIASAVIEDSVGGDNDNDEEEEEERGRPVGQSPPRKSEGFQNAVMDLERDAFAPRSPATVSRAG